MCHLACLWDFSLAGRYSIYIVFLSMMSGGFHLKEARAAWAIRVDVGVWAAGIGTVEKVDDLAH